MARKRDDGNEITEEILSKLEKDIQKEYKQAYKEVRKKLKDFTESFEAERKQKLQDIKSGEITYTEYRDWCERKIFVSDRWKAMKESLAEDLANSDKIARSMAVQHSPEVYSVNHSFAGYQVSRDAAINPSFTIYNRRAVETLIRDKPDLLPVASKKMDIPKDKRWNEKKINSVVTQSILQGKPIDDVADSLVKVVGMDMSAAVRNARTMITNAQNRGRQDAFDELKEKGIPIREKWVATLDNRTRHSHRLMHGVYKNKDGYYPNGLRYPGDELGDPEEVYNCRCTEIAEVGEFAIDTPMHSSKMGEMTFDEWIQEGTGKADWYEAYNSDEWEIPDNKWKFEDQEEPQDLKEEADQEEDLKEEEEEVKEVFVPAETIEEAQEYASRFADSVNYKGMSVKNANAVNEYLTDLTRKYPINTLENLGVSSTRGAIMRANFSSITMNPKKLGKVLTEEAEIFKKRQDQIRANIEIMKGRYSGKIPSAVQRKIDKLTDSLNFTRWAVHDNYDDHLKAVLSHEYGHLLSDQYFGMINDIRANPAYRANPKMPELKRRWEDAFYLAIDNGDIYTLSEYGRSNVYEFFAESFAAREMGETLPSYVEELMKETLENGIMQ